MNKKMSLASVMLASGLILAACGQGEEKAKIELEDVTDIESNLEETETETETEETTVADESEQAEESGTVEENEKENKEGQQVGKGNQENKNEVSQQNKPATTKPSTSNNDKNKDNQTNQNNQGNSNGQGQANNDNATNETENKAPAYTFAAADILNKVKTAYGEDYLPNMQLDDEMIKMTFQFDLSLAEDYVAEMPMISFHPDKVLIVKAKEGKIKEVVAQLEATRKDLLENGLTYPSNLEKFHATKVVSKGDYAAFFMLGSANNMSEDPEERVKFAEKEIQKAVDTFYSLFKE